MNPVSEFEEAFSKYTGAAHSIAVSNGTAALITAINSLNLPEGSRIVTTPYTFPATANAIILCGHKPVFVDVGEDYLIKPEEIRNANDPDAVLVVHLFGKPCRIKQIIKNHCPVIEDCSQATGLRIDGKHVGTFGDAGTFSFYASKNLSTFEGGMVITNRASIAESARRFINHGFEDAEMVELGYNFKIPWICAFIGQQTLALHKTGVEAELKNYGPHGKYYPKLVYQHYWYQKNPDRWEKMDCPTAENLARRISLG